MKKSANGVSSADAGLDRLAVYSLTARALLLGLLVLVASSLLAG